MKEFWTFVKKMMTTKEGWISWLLANLVVNIPWIVFLILYLLTWDNKYVTTASVIYVAMWLPPPIEPFIVGILTPMFYRIMTRYKKKRVVEKPR